MHARTTRPANLSRRRSTSAIARKGLRERIAIVCLIFVLFVLLHDTVIFKARGVMPILKQFQSSVIYNATMESASRDREA